MNISELARQLKTEPQVLLEKLPELGIHIGERAIQIDDGLVEKAKEVWKMHERREKLKAKMAAREDHKDEETKAKEAVEGEHAIKIPASVTVSDFAKRINVDVTKVIVKLMQEGVMAAMNQKIDYETAHIVAEDFEIKTELGEDEAEDGEESKELDQILSKEKNLIPRDPVVVVMGHVDHGKTSLLDQIRKTQVVDGESGSITQHIGAYQVSIKHPTTKENHQITFIDTPGHEAFSGMRSRGGQVADIAVLVIAADDKIQPQTLESIEIIQKENLGLVVAINKIDKPDADVDRIKTALSEINLSPEDWGGDVLTVPLSAKAGTNIDQLLENILLLAEIEELKANPDGELFATTIESHIDKGLGPVATVIVQNGTLKIGDLIKCCHGGGRLKGLLDFQGHRLKKAGPSTPVQLLGLKHLPKSGEVIERAKSTRELKKLTKRHRLVVAEVEVKGKQKQEKLRIKIYLKADVLGTLEALISEISKIRHELVDIKVVKQSLGEFTETDVLEAEAEGAVLVGFKAGATSGAEHLINTRNVKFKTYDVIYKLLDDLKNSLEELLPPKIIEENVGKVKVLAIFSKGNQTMIVGAQVLEGLITPDLQFRIFTNNEIMGEGKVKELQIGKNVVKKVKAPQEFGLKMAGDLIIKEGDELRFYTTREEKRTL